MDASEIEALWLDAADLVYEARNDRDLRRSDHEKWKTTVNRATENANALYEAWCEVRTPEQARTEIDDIVNEIRGN